MYIYIDVLLQILSHTIGYQITTASEGRIINID